jgi:hypothetical protein
MLCMDLWREGEYPVDNLHVRTESGVSKGFCFVAVSYPETSRIKKYYYVKNFIKKLYRARPTLSNRGDIDDV